MPGHGGILWFTVNAPDPGVANIQDSSAYLPTICGHCGTNVAAAVLARVRETLFPAVKWIRCPACHKGSVVVDDRQYPSPLPGEDLEGLPADVAPAYAEAREAMGAGAFTAGELMCRKLLMHVAVDKKAKENLTFAAYVDYLESKGYITEPMKPWAAVIRLHGNIATHEIPATDGKRGLGTLAFTTQLLRTIYEMEYKVAQYLPPQPSPDAPSSEQPPTPAV